MLSTIISAFAYLISAASPLIRACCIVVLVGFVVIFFGPLLKTKDLPERRSHPKQRSHPEQRQYPRPSGYGHPASWNEQILRATFNSSVNHPAAVKQSKRFPRQFRNRPLSDRIQKVLSKAARPIERIVQAPDIIPSVYENILKDLKNDPLIGSDMHDLEVILAISYLKDIKLEDLFSEEEKEDPNCDISDKQRCKAALKEVVEMITSKSDQYVHDLTSSDITFRGELILVLNGMFESLRKDTDYSPQQAMHDMKLVYPKLATLLNADFSRVRDVYLYVYSEPRINEMDALGEATEKNLDSFDEELWMHAVRKTLNNAKDQFLKTGMIDASFVHELPSNDQTNFSDEYEDSSIFDDIFDVPQKALESLREDPNTRREIDELGLMLIMSSLKTDDLDEDGRFDIAIMREEAQDRKPKRILEQKSASESLQEANDEAGIHAHLRQEAKVTVESIAKTLRVRELMVEKNLEELYDKMLECVDRNTSPQLTLEELKPIASKYPELAGFTMDVVYPNIFFSTQKHIPEYYIVDKMDADAWKVVLLKAIKSSRDEFFEKNVIEFSD